LCFSSTLCVLYTLPISPSLIEHPKHLAESKHFLVSHFVIFSILLLILSVLGHNILLNTVLNVLNFTTSVIYVQWYKITGLLK